MQITRDDFEHIYLPEKQFRILKQYYSKEQIEIIKKERQQLWRKWRELILTVYKSLPPHSCLAKPYIESWTNGWQMKGHFYATFRKQNREQEATCISLLWNTAYLKIGYEWQAYKAKKSATNVQTHNQNLLAKLSQMNELTDCRIWTSAHDEFAPFLLLADYLLDEPNEVNRELALENGLGIGFIFPKTDIPHPAELLKQSICLLEPLYQG